MVLLRDRVGEEAFKKGIQNYLNKYAFKNVTIPNLIEELEMVSNTNLDDFEKLWLENPEFPHDQVVAFLEEKNISIKTYFELKNKIAKQPEKTESILKRAWKRIKSNQYRRTFKR